MHRTSPPQSGAKRRRPSDTAQPATPVEKCGAMYVRMSTDHQKYSTENQEKTIREYADRRQVKIVKTYSDSGKSGLSIDGRDALKQLIEHVQSGMAEFSVILVLDVTRWGRFQDADESAYYEYICRRSGIDVQYVAEQFENDGSPVSTIIKSVKRSMAGEFSRELSVKVFGGQCTLLEKGFKMCGPAGYGLRRMLISEHGEEKGILQRKQRKSLQDDRVVLVPGPPEEIETVQWMYRAFVEEDMNESEIMAVLNQRGILTDYERPWTRSTVHQVLTNEKYIGNYLFNRTSFKLKKRRVHNPPDMWVRKERAFPAVVEPQYFYEAQRIIYNRSKRLSDDEMLDLLRALQERTGWLSGVVINETEGMPSSTAYSYRFGSLRRAYQLIGYTPGFDYQFVEVNRRLRELHSEIVEDTIKEIHDMGGTVQRDAETDLLTINGLLKASIVICRCQQSQAGSFRWKIHFDTSLRPDITIAIRMNERNEQPLDYYLLPGLDIEQPSIRLLEQNSIALDAYRFDDLEPFFMMTQPVAIKEAA